jgi:hypothetical protein
MAATITTTLQLNGSKLFTAKIDILGDAAGDTAGVTIIDPANLTGVPATFKIRAIQWDLDGTFTCQLLWDATTDVHAYELGLASGAKRFSDTGAHLVNNGGAGVTGKLLLTTLGLTTGGKGTIIVEGQH